MQVDNDVIVLIDNNFKNAFINVFIIYYILTRKDMLKVQALNENSSKNEIYHRSNRHRIKTIQK